MVRGGLVGMGVRVGADHIADLDVITTNLVGDVIEDTEAGNHLEFVGGLGRR